jgi:hypothetical protein
MRSIELLATVRRLCVSVQINIGQNQVIANGV